MKIELYLVRHGTTVCNERGVFCGQPDYPLSPGGVSELKRLVTDTPYPQADLLFSSPSVRCLETAAIAFPGLVPVIVDNLQEFHFGSFEERPAADLAGTSMAKGFAAGDPDFHFPGGETMRQLMERAFQAFDYIIREAIASSASRIAILTHACLMSVFLAHTLTPAPGRGDLFCPNGMGFLVCANSDQWLSSRTLCLAGLLPEGAPRPNPGGSPYIVE